MSRLFDIHQGGDHMMVFRGESRCATMTSSDGVAGHRSIV